MRFLLIGGARSGEYIDVDPDEGHIGTYKVLRPSPRLPYLPAGLDDCYAPHNVDTYDLLWVRPSGWVFSFRAYVLSGFDKRDLAMAMARPPNRHTYCELPDAPREDPYECRRCRWAL